MSHNDDDDCWDDNSPLIESSIKLTIPQQQQLLHTRKIVLTELVCLLFFTVCSGPVGSEEAIGAVGPVGLLFFIIFPIVYCIPIALLYSECSCRYPENGGFLVWTRHSYGNFASFQVGYFRWLSSVMNSSLFAIILTDTILNGFGAVHRVVRLLVTSIVCSFIGFVNFKGIGAVGSFVMLFLLCALVPYICMFFVSVFQWGSVASGSVIVHQVHTNSSGTPVTPRQHDWLRLLQVLFWDYNGWDSGAAYAGQISNPDQNIPRATWMGLMLVMLAYSMPLAIGLAYAGSPAWVYWKEETMFVIAETMGHGTLLLLVKIGTWIQLCGMFVSEVFCNGYVVVGLVNAGFIPEVCGKKSSNAESPYIAISAHLVLIVIFSQSMSFETILVVNNTLVALVLIIEVTAALIDRRSVDHGAHNNHHQGVWRANISTFVFTMMMLIPLLTIFVILGSAVFHANLTVHIMTGVFVLMGILFYAVRPKQLLNRYSSL